MDSHPLDVMSLVFGAVFVLIGLVVLGGAGLTVPLQWLGPLLVVLLGVWLLVTARPKRDDAAE
jgi:hypothetical protein